MREERKGRGERGRRQKGRVEGEREAGVSDTFYSSLGDTPQK